MDFSITTPDFRQPSDSCPGNVKVNKFLRNSALILCLIFGGLNIMAEVNFSVLPIMVDDEVSEETAKVIFRKTEQILTRNSAAAAGEADVFAVESKLTVNGESKSSGLVRDITSISGELTLIALNKVDNTRFYSVTVPLKTAVTGSKDPVLSLAGSIKPTDAVYTRFVRISREKIAGYYSEHCNDILTRARNMSLAGKTRDALSYLSGMPPTAPCHDECLELMQNLRTTLDEEFETTIERRKKIKEILE